MAASYKCSSCDSQGFLPACSLLFISEEIQIFFFPFMRGSGFRLCLLFNMELMLKYKCIKYIKHACIEVVSFY